MVTNQQVWRLLLLMKSEKTKGIAAVKAGMEEKTARKYVGLGKLPSDIKGIHNWRTGQDAFEKVWNAVREMLHDTPGLEVKTIFEYLQREKRGEYHDGQLRTV